MKNYTLHFIRHGLTLGNEQGKYIGATDLPLSENGRAELYELCKTLQYPNIQIVYASPLIRCLETAEILYPDNFVKTVDAIKEYDFGVFENKSMDELKNTNAFKTWVESGMIAAPEGGESKADFDLRVEQGLDEILSDMMKNKITSAAVITHGGVIMSLLAKFGLPQLPPFQWQTQSGCGFTVTTSSYLWGGGRTFEIMDRIPLDVTVDVNDEGYNLFDVE